MALHRLHRFLRVAWLGEEACFAVVHLMHWRSCGSYRDPKTVKEFFDVETVMTAAGCFEQQRVDRGILFDRWGGITKDYDAIERRPVLIMAVNAQYGLKTADMYNGWLLEYVRRNLMTVRENYRRRVEAAKKRGRELESDITDVTREMQQFWYHEGNKTGQSSTTMAKKHIEETPRLKNLRAGKYDFTDHYVNRLPEAMRKEAAKA